MVAMEHLVAGSATPICRAGVATSIGPGRLDNEDASLCGPAWYAVADGVGGRRGGGIASRTAVDVLARRPAPTSIEDVSAALQHINRAIRERARASALWGMASTVVGMVDVGGEVLVFHVGDSRCYHLVEGRLDLLTRDHSYVSDLIEAGRISASEAGRHRHRNVITRALGVDATVSPDLRPIVAPIGRLLLCTDGVSSVLGDAAIALVLAGDDDPQLAAERLVWTAVANGSQDDATAVVLDGRPGR